MRKFDGILLCTDFDGTLASHAEVSPENCEAIRYFQENGGRFTVVSGRHPLFLKAHQNGFRVNAPLVGYNGGLILDENTDEILYAGGRSDFKALELGRPYWENGRITRLVAHDGSTHSYRCTHSGAEDAAPDVDALKAMCTLPFYNALCVTETEEEAIALRDELIALSGEEFSIARSWPIGIEIMCAGDNKGAAALRLKKMVGARLLVTAGDFENDISMIKSANIGYAVDNATDAVKAVADRITVNHRDHAIAAIIAELEKAL
ncbi:MAG: HAD-IIB family hydrolase [Clostridia bacterium]|nr:HAD-IIB family hydrolase [Clostridia bacterium]